MKRVLAALLFASFVQPVLGHDGEHHDKKGASAAVDSMTQGEVRRVDKEAKKLTIRHGPIANLDMPAMTMVFQVKDVSVLERFKPGDKIRFVAEKLDGAYVASNIEAAH